MFDSPPISQLSLMNLQSQKLCRCAVFCPIDNDLTRIELQFNDDTSVQQIIHEAIISLKEKKQMNGIDLSEHLCCLFASRRNGRKCSDLPSFEQTQKISLTGIKHFYLESSLTTQKRSPAKKIKNASLSTRSIQSQMNQAPKQKKEVKASKGIGCLCFS